MGTEFPLRRLNWGGTETCVTSPTDLFEGKRKGRPCEDEFTVLESRVWGRRSFGRIEEKTTTRPSQS